MPRKPKDPEYYVSNKEMLLELQKYHETGFPSEELGSMFLKIATRYSTKDKFCGYTYKDEMVGAAVLRMVQQINQFDITRPNPNPFAYFTKITHNQFLMVLNSEKRIHATKDAYRDEFWHDFAIDENISSNEDRKDYNL